MSIEIVSGRSKSGKTQYIYNKIASLVREGEQAILIVPEQFSHSAEKHLLELVGTIDDRGVEVFSFAHLATATESKVGQVHRNKINQISKVLIIRNIIADCKLEFYKNASKQNGFTEMFADSIDEMKKYMLTPDTLVQIANETQDTVLAMKLRDFSLVYKKYEEKLAEIYDDADDSLTILSKQISEFNVYKDKHIFLDEFDTFVPQELDIIRALAATCKNVTISICSDESEINTTLFMPTNNTQAKLSKTLNNNIKYTSFEKSHFASEAISHLEKNLFSFRPELYKGDSKDVQVFSLSNPLAEVENCALKIKNLISDCGYKYSDIGVVCSDISVYNRHLERVFDYADIEFFVDTKEEVINHHLVRFVLGLLEIYIEDYSYNTVFNYLKTSFVTAKPSHIALLERFIQKTGIRRLTWLDDKKWNSIVQANYNDDDSPIKILNTIREKYILPLAKMHEKIKGKNTVLDVATVLFEYISFLGVPEIIANYIKKFEDEGELRLSKEYEKIWEIILDTLDEVVQLNSDVKLSPKSFYELLVTAFSQQKMGFIPQTADCVVIGNVERTRFDNVKILFVLGVNETVFPVAPKPDGVFGDSDKVSMSDCGVEFSTTSTIAAYYSQYLAYRTFTMPSEKLFISYSKCDNEFKTLRKSYIIDRILKMFKIEEKSELAFDDISSLYARGPAREALSRNMAQYNSGVDISPEWRDLYEYFNGTDFTEKLDNFATSDNFAGKISDSNMRKLIPVLSRTSVSKLERYMACKYAYFIDYILHLETPKEKVIDERDIGTITHEILEIISRKYASDIAVLSSCNESEIMDEIDSQIDKYISDFSACSDELSARDSYAIKRLKNSILLCFKAVKKQLLDSKFEPLGYEIEFNEESDMGPIKLLTESGEEVILTGKIDRADIYTDGDTSYVRVIDYKTGSKKLRLDEVFYGLNLQLMVYLSKLVGIKENCKHGGALYFSVSDVFAESEMPLSTEEAIKAVENKLGLKGFVPYDEALLEAYDKKMAASVKRENSSGKAISLSDFEIIDEYIKLKLSEICTDMFSGDFKVSPCKKSEFSACDYCRYGSVCRFDPTNKEDKYRFFKSVTLNSRIIDEMEVKLNVDNAPTECD